MAFEFATAQRIIFGNGKIEELGIVAAPFGGPALVVIGQSKERAQVALNALATADIEPQLFQVSGEPTIELVEEGMETARETNCQLVISFGGGSVIDTGKAIAALLTNGDDPMDFLEVIGRGKPITQAPLPFIAIPTTAGTGSEVTRNAVLASTEHQVKVSLRNPMMLPKVAIVDPELTLSLPPAITASTGLDALTQVIEPYISIKRNPITDAVCLQGMWYAANSLPVVYQDGQDLLAREAMATASMMGGLALANAGLGAVHGFAGPFGGMFHAPHGSICAALLSESIAINLQALREREPENPALERFDDLANILTGDPTATPEDAIQWLEDLVADLEIPPLRTFGVQKDDFPSLIEKARVSSSMKGNPIELTADEMQEILERSF
jgi:alcohol dehydrogenase class IV